MRKFIRYLGWVLAISPCLSLMANNPKLHADETALADFNQFVNEELHVWKVPGVAVVILLDAKVIRLQGYGFRDAKRQQPVTPHTIFPIASITKSFTVSELGMLVDEGKLNWDERVRTYLPDFCMYDPVVTERLTIRDLVTHRSGLPAHNLIWYSNPDLPRKGLIDRLRYLQPSADFRQTFQYSNLMFMVAGYIGGLKNGTSWEAAVKQRLLTPLEMKNTNFSTMDSQRTNDFSLPYRLVNETATQIPFYEQNESAIGPAGEINSTIEDISHYLAFQMNQGTYLSKRLLTVTNALQMQMPQMVIQEAPEFPEISEISYGMGFRITQYRGHKLVYHDGDINGFHLKLAFLPDDHIGLAIFANLTDTPLTNIVAYNIFDRILGLDQIPWSSRFLKIREKEQFASKGGNKLTQATSGTVVGSARAFADYEGEYEHPGYGKIRIVNDRGKLSLTLNDLSPSVLVQLHPDVFLVPDDPEKLFQGLHIVFQRDYREFITGLSMPLEPAVSDIVFARLPNAPMTENHFLEQFAGQYLLPDSFLTVSLNGDHSLAANLPGQPMHRLIARRNTLFDVEGINGGSLEFKKDDSGAYARAIYCEEGACVLAEKKRD